MLNTLKLRTLYVLHMILPLPLVSWHIDRLSPDTVRALLALHTP